MTTTNIVTLAVYLSRSGASFAVCHNGRLHDFGTKGATGSAERVEKAMRIAQQLITHYSPDILILEKQGARRTAAVWAMYQSIARYARTKKIQVFRYARKDIQSAFRANNKHAMNITIAVHFPNLKSRMPSERRSWDAESYRQGLYDAASLALTHFIRTQGFVL